MSGFKKALISFRKNAWECFKHSIAPGVMHFVASMVVMLVLANMEDEVDWNNLLTWSIVSGAVSVAYGGFLCFALGGAHFEMLVSGNMKRRSAFETGSELTISAHKLEKEYRPWKGFVVGLYSAIPIVIGGILLGANQKLLVPDVEMGKGLSVWMLILDLLAGFVLLPVQMYNRLGFYWNGYLACLFALIPVVVSGGCYIWGAYAKRNKTLRQQEIQARQIAETENKPKKINYGGLPGTKPKKKK